MSTQADRSSAFVAYPAGAGHIAAQGCKHVHFIRHAQGTHNEAEERAEREATYADPADVLLESNSGKRYWDPNLTSKGASQCENLQQNFPSLDIELVVTSPFRRTLQTAMLSIPALRRNDGGLVPKLLVTELCRERIHKYMCDTHIYENT